VKLHIEEFFKTFKNQKYVEQLKKIPQKFKAEHNDEEKVTIITIYGLIGDYWLEDSVSASDIDKAIKEAGDNDLIIYLNSPGGDAFDGITIYNRLKRHPGNVTVYVDGWACSAASVIAMAADKLIMGLGSMMMIHEATSFVWGTKRAMRKEADVLEELEEGIIDIYMTKAQATRDEIRQMVDAETWFSAQKAVEMGFADEVESSQQEGGIQNLISDTQLQQIIDAVTNNLKQKNTKESDEPQAPTTKKPIRFIF